MSTTVTDDRILLSNADTNTGWATHTAHGGNVGIQANDVISVQGTGSVPMRVNGNGLGGLAFDTGAANVDITNDHIWTWAFTNQLFDNDINNGVIIGISTTLDASGSAAAMRAGGLDTNIGPVKNFHMFCVDANRPFETTAPAVLGTPPALTAVRSFYFNWKFTTNNGRIAAFIDEMRRGDGITLTGGTSGVPGNSDDVATLDTSNGRGTFKDVGGVFFILGRVTIGNAGSDVTSHFTDTGKVWNFEGQHVSATFHRIVFVGNSGAAVQVATFGTEVGTGITASGSGGNVFQSGGDIPFRIEAIDSNIAVNLFGCQMINAPTLFEDPWRQVQVEDGAVFQTPITRNTNDSGTNDANPFPGVAAINDHVYFGHNERFNHITINVGTIGVGTYTLSYEYSDGTGWTALTDVTDNTTNLKTIGSNTITYSIPDNWSNGNTVNSITGKYWIRAVHDAGTRTTSPLISQSTAGIGGGLRAEQVNFKAVSGTWTNMDTVRIRNGAILRKITFVNSVAPAKSAQLDFGSTDFTADSVRDITIIGANKAILLKGTATGTTTYNFRNIKFAGNTKKVRVDFPAAATVIIKILNGGDNIVDPTDIDNVNGSTVNIENTVAVTVSGVTQGASVKIIADATVGTVTAGDVLLAVLADSTGSATFNHNFEGNLATIVRVRASGNPSAGIRDDGGVLTDQTALSNNSITNDMELLPAAAQVIGDTFQLGHAEKFGQMKLSVSTAGTGGFTITWQYWNGTIWTNLSGVTDPSSSYAVTGDHIISWIIPGDWVTKNDLTLGNFFYVRGRFSAGTVSISPLGRFVTLDVTKYLPFTQNRIITSTGLSVVASWNKDTIAQFM